MKLTKEKISGYIGSLIFCAIMLLILWFSVLKTIVPEKEAGILVNFGTVDEAFGEIEPWNQGSNDASSVPEIPAEILSPEPQPVIAQNLEQTVSIDTEKKKIEEEKRKQEQLLKEQERQAELERKRKEEAQQQAINSQVAGAFGAGSASSAGQGAETGQGNQGSSQGNSDQGDYTGVGRYGDFSLTGRRLGPEGLPRPAYSVQEEGVIVVDITVDKNGNVISAIVGKGTTIDNTTLRRSALEAAGKAKFNAISGNENQSGKITYRYYLR